MSDSTINGHRLELIAALARRAGLTRQSTCRRIVTP
jgi:hypothetical protein